MCWSFRAQKAARRRASYHDTCLLSDVYLPGMNGVELWRHLAEAGSRLPTILMTGRDDEHTRRLMREAKPIASLFKPFDEAALLRAIRKAMRRPIDPSSSSAARAYSRSEMIPKIAGKFPLRLTVHFARFSAIKSRRSE